MIWSGESIALGAISKLGQFNLLERILKQYVVRKCEVGFRPRNLYAKLQPNVTGELASWSVGLDAWDGLERCWGLFQKELLTCR